MKIETKEEREALLKMSFEEKLEWSKQTIKDTLAVAKRPIVQFSGGADSCVLAWLVHSVDPTVKMVFHDWGLFLPRTKEFAIEYFKKYNMDYMITDSGYNYKTFLKEKGLPLFKGFKFINRENLKKYNITEDCRKLKNYCWSKTKKAFKPDYYFIGITADESPQRMAIFKVHGVYQKKSGGLTQVKPIVLFTKDEVFKILKENDILWEKDSYEYEFKGKMVNWHENCAEKKKELGCFYSDLECFMCLTRFKSEGWGRFGRLARSHPKEFKEVMDMGIKDSMEQIIKDYPEKTKYVQEFLDIYYYKTKKEAVDVQQTF